MNKEFTNIAIVVVLVVVVAGAVWFYMDKPSILSTSETTQISTSQETTDTQPTINNKPAANEVSFTTPAGYVVEQEPSYQDVAWHQTSGIDKRISIIKDQYVNEARSKSVGGAGTGGSASITIDFNRNPNNWTVQQWLKEKVGCSAQELTTYSFKDRTGVRCVPLSGQHLYDGIAVQHKGWIVYILNSYDTDSEAQVFNQLLASITFAK
jgi:hypothetical protein